MIRAGFRRRKQVLISRLQAEKRGNVKEIILRNGNKTIVDDEDFERISKLSWNQNFYGYVCSYVNAGTRTNKTGNVVTKSKLVYLAREILQAGNKEQVDHINHDKLDNRRSNLRIANHTQQKMNRRMFSNNKSGFKGVVFERGRYKATISINGKKVHIGVFDTPIEAAKAYDEKAKVYYGEFACLNF